MTETSEQQQRNCSWFRAETVSMCFQDEMICTRQF